MTIDELLNIDPYSLSKEEKEALYDQQIKELVRYHYASCLPYRKMMDAMGIDMDHLPSYNQIPFLPVRLFKEFELRSVEQESVVKTLTSSGTTSQAVSRIFLDRETALMQQKVMTKIVSSFIGSKRIPMLIIDSPSVIKDRRLFSARGAGILGFSIFGSKKEYALDEEMELDVERIKEFAEQHKNEPVFLFGFTFMIWQHFYKKLREKNLKIDLSNAFLIHGGGWKKLQNERVSSEDFKQKLNEICGILPQNIHDYYGMVEQTGSLYMECEYGHLHASIFSDVIVRRAKDFSVANNNETGIIQVSSLVPKSYPGHVLLTEDEGMILGEDDCKCGRKGKYFTILGRIKNAEIRGCSDTYAAKF